MAQDQIRNFAIIAHIDHGKSTLADRLLELTGTIPKREMQAQILDSNPIERERGITIKLAPVRMVYQGFIFNLIDTPGHVDFSYEVSRSLAACEGALLVVDATQGVQAQTLANLHQARRHNLTIIPIINKIDLSNARIEVTQAEIETLGFSKEEILQISAKTGENVEKVLEAIVKRIPPPRGQPEASLRALVFSSQYDSHKGVVVFVRIVDGQIGAYRGSPFNSSRQGPDRFGLHRDVSAKAMTGLEKTRRAAPIQVPRLQFLASGAQVTPIEIGYFSPKMTPSHGLQAGEVGYVATGLKDARMAKVGDTLRLAPLAQGKPESPIKPLLGYQEPKPMVFLGLFPIKSEDTTLAREAMERLRLSDSAFSFRPIHSIALGNGFHCGFLGLLHAEIVQERLSREFGLNMLATAPSVEYRIKLKGAYHSQVISIQSASEFPDPSLIEEVREPVMNVVIYSPKQYVGPIMQLSQEKRGELVDQTYLGDQVTLTYLLPLSEMIVDFFDRLKSLTEGYASLDYEFYDGSTSLTINPEQRRRVDYQPVSLVKVDVLVNKEKVDAFSFLCVEGETQRRSRELVERLARAIPRQQFEVPVQAAIGGQVIARADVKAFRKDVTQKLYGGDRTRKDKLLEAQKKGKARMKVVGRVEIPQSAFFEVLKRT